MKRVNLDPVSEDVEMVQATRPTGITERVM
jgi:hypothetical protein